MLLLMSHPVAASSTGGRSSSHYHDHTHRNHSYTPNNSVHFRTHGLKIGLNTGTSIVPLRTKYLNLRTRATSMVDIATELWEEESMDFTTGPLSGDLSEIEAFCRIQRLAEELHKAVMDSLRRLESKESDVSWGESRVVFSSSLEDRVASGLACVGATLQQGRTDILGGWTRDLEQEMKQPRLARFRESLRGCMKSLRTSLQSLIAPEGERNLAVYRILQRLNNICLDAGFPRPSSYPGHGNIPNFGRVRLEQTSETVAFWRGGQLTEEGLEWLLENDFKTIVDLRAEDPENTLAEFALMEAEKCGKIRRVRIPVKRETAPSMDQVREFAKLVADVENQPVFLHSYAGVVRASAMTSRWREFVFRGGLKCDEPENESEVCEVDDLWPEDDEELEEISREEGPQVGARGLSPFHAQAPGPDVFSRKGMSDFYRNRRITPSSILSRRPSLSRNRSLNGETTTVNNIPRGSTNGAVSGNTPKPAVDHTVVGGDMCSTKTGVVRIQSRRKAEMYLVRTDGYSCIRERVMESTLAFTHPSTQQQMLMWKTPPKTVLLLKKLGDELMGQAMEVASFLHNHEGMNVMVEPDVHDGFARYPGFGFIQTFYSHDIGSLHERVDFVVCLGGDGVILHASNLFRNAVPPVVSFNLGSLGFLTAHPFEDYKHDLRAIIRGSERIEGVYVTLRMRLRCEILRDGKLVPGKVFEVLNEVVVDRGSNPYLCKIECYERKRLITKVQADGVLVATPTGSTAYSTAAGGSMVHPNVPCMLFTPICPHSLSFRPVILPDSAILELKLHCLGLQCSSLQVALDKSLATLEAMHGFPLMEKRGSSYRREIQFAFS